MPTLNRRGFLQMIGAAGVTPLLPVMPARAVAGVAVTSPSKALWAGIYAKSGSAPQFLKVAQSMGLPNRAIQGIGARSVGVKLAITAATNPAARVAVARGPALVPSRTEPLKTARKILRDIDRFATAEPVEAIAPENADTGTVPPEAS